MFSSWYILISLCRRPFILLCRRVASLEVIRGRTIFNIERTICAPFVCNPNHKVSPLIHFTIPMFATTTRTMTVDDANDDCRRQRLRAPKAFCDCDHGDDERATLQAESTRTQRSYREYFGQGMFLFLKESKLSEAILPRFGSLVPGIRNQTLVFVSFHLTHLTSCTWNI